MQPDTAGRCANQLRALAVPTVRRRGFHQVSRAVRSILVNVPPQHAIDWLMLSDLDKLSCRILYGFSIQFCMGFQFNFVGWVIGYTEKSLYKLYYKTTKFIFYSHLHLAHLLNVCITTVMSY